MERYVEKVEMDPCESYYGRNGRWPSDKHSFDGGTKKTGEQKVLWIWLRLWAPYGGKEKETKNSVRGEGERDLTRKQTDGNQQVVNGIVRLAAFSLQMYSQLLASLRGSSSKILRKTCG